MIGYLKKTVLTFSILSVFFFFSPFKLFSATTLTTNSEFTHVLKENGIIESSINFRISSEQTTVLSYYTITLAQKDIDPRIHSVNRNQPLEATVYNRSNSTDILIDLENIVISKDAPAEILISYTQRYTDKNILDIPSKIIDTPTSKVSISYPKSWEEVSWISDQIQDLKKSDTEYILTLFKPDSNSVKLIFNQDIIYSFEISRSLNNTSDLSNQYEIVLPMDTQFQKVVLEDISLKPTQSITDSSGNYILIFTLEPQTQKDLKISGYIIMEKHQYYKSDFPTTNYSRDIYWSIEKEQIGDIEKFFKQKGVNSNSEKPILAQYIYQYVVDRLKPSTSASSLSGGVRRGATDTLKDSENASAEDYADVLQAFLSHYEVPSIYSIGFVSDISSYQEKGMFHYWVQAYIDNDWMVLDPYLEDYSKVSLWSREQLDHISILNRTDDSISPILTYYSDNDINFEYIKDATITYTPKSNVSISLEPYSILNRYLYGSINIENSGNTIFTDIELTKSQPELNKYIDSVSNPANTILLPHESKNINFHLPFNTVENEIIFTNVVIKNGTESVDNKLASTEYSISEHTGYEVMIKLVSVLLFLITFSIIYVVINKFIYKK